MMIMTDPRKGIWIVPGISHDSHTENHSTSVMGVLWLSVLQSTNDVKYASSAKWVHWKQEYLLNTVITQIKGLKLNYG